MSWRIKVIVPILFLHLLAIPLLMSRYLHFYEESVWEGQRLFAESLMEKVQDEIAIHQRSTRGDPHRIVYTLDKLWKSYSFRNLSLYDSKGEVLATAGGNPDHSPASDNRAVIRKTPDGTVMDLTLWLQNRSTCQTCHGTEEKFLGAIQGVYSMAQSDSMLKTARLHTFLFIFFTITVVFLLVYLFLDHFVTQPVHQVMKAFRNVERGQLDTRIDLRRKDEIGTMAHQFNEMVDSLRKARKELESSHREGMVRAEQLATVGEIAAGLAHEVKNPLAGISSALEVIRSEVGEIGRAHV